MTRYLDPVLLRTVATTATSRVRLNASTLSTFYYEPPHLARLLTTLDVLSDGRLDVGVGLGWMKDEHDIARSADWHRRGEMLDDLLAFLHAWWTTTRCPGIVSFSRVRGAAGRGRRPLAVDRR
jgi:alkanesulfonate monooxygenase SsuD/methylene tetrahydromethanopterin reductase-like flavin-dependent oxidoreductase (luciferase family)